MGEARGINGAQDKKEEQGRTREIIGGVRNGKGWQGRAREGKGEQQRAMESKQR
jgi:hypothetical protein